MTEATRDVAILLAYDANGVEVFRDRIGLFEYWDALHPVIDDQEFRSSRGITRLVGKLYESDGSITQEFENTYDLSGKLETSHARHQDGTETNI
jgi:hypothetical protein